jgi:hypothetical protein
MARLATRAPLSLTPGAPHAAPAPRPAAGPRAGLVAVALLTVVIVTGVAGSSEHPAAPLAVADPCVSAAAVAALAAWPPAAPPAADDDYEVRGERRPEALVVPTEFRDFQACRQRAGG